MSRIAIRILIVAALALVIIAGTYMSVKALSSATGQNSLGMYMLGGSLSNPFSDQSVEEAAQQLEPYKDPGGGGHDCESEGNSSDL